MKSTPSQLSVVLTSDHSIIREAFKLLLTKLGFEVVGESHDIESTLGILSKSVPHLLLLDLELNSKSGLEVLYKIRAQNLSIKILVISKFIEDEIIRQTILAGANGFVHKNCSSADLALALNQVFESELFLPKQFEHLTVSIGQELEKFKKSSKKRNSHDPLNRLSNREREVFFLIADGQPNRNIATNLLISPRTVETHRTRIMNKLGCKSNANLIKYAIKHKLISL